MPEASLAAEADLILRLGAYDPYSDHAWNGARLAQRAQQTEKLLSGCEAAAVRQVLDRTRRRHLEPWHQPMLETALRADSVACFARALMELIERARAGGGTIVYSSD